MANGAVLQPTVVLCNAMQISRRTSGGRGEYEITGTAANGLRAAELENFLLTLEFPNGILIHTRVRVVKQGGKLRLRMADADIQAQKQLAAVFMMPDPSRQTTALGAGEPVMQEGAYAIEHIDIASVLVIPPESAVLRVNKIIVLNRSHLAHEVDLRERGVMLEQVWNRRHEFPDDIAFRLEQHQNSVQTHHIDCATQKLVADVQRYVADRSADLNIVYSSRDDVLLKLCESLHYQVAKPILLIDDIDPEDIEMKKRIVKDWKRWANGRGPASAKFRQEVRKAYSSTCFLCGAYLPQTSYNSTPGVDAAHIMPWNEDELDEVFNGLCLCKLHHWAFDEAIVIIRYENGNYVSEIPEQAEREILELESEFSIKLLKTDLGVIPVERLPSAQRHWPHPELFQNLAAAY
jgi:putative restriction endonuclease